MKNIYLGDYAYLVEAQLKVSYKELTKDNVARFSDEEFDAAVQSLIESFDHFFQRPMWELMGVFVPWELTQRDPSLLRSGAFELRFDKSKNEWVLFDKKIKPNTRLNAKLKIDRDGVRITNSYREKFYGWDKYIENIRARANAMLASEISKYAYNYIEKNLFKNPTYLDLAHHTYMSDKQFDKAVRSALDFINDFLQARKKEVGPALDDFALGLAGSGVKNRISTTRASIQGNKIVFDGKPVGKIVNYDRDGIRIEIAGNRVWFYWISGKKYNRRDIERKITSIGEYIIHVIESDILKLPDVTK